ncbi:MAG: GH3 auxin-responsive promoter family protein, partial [Anaerolineaceae bacterium]
MPTLAVELLRQGHADQVWTKYCGFLDLNTDEFMKIQGRLLMEQISLISKTDIGKLFFRDKVLNSQEEFRDRVPITTYSDYEPLLSQEASMYKDAYVWAHTSGRSGAFKWVP